MYSIGQQMSERMGQNFVHGTIQACLSIVFLV
jgi:hypothetical protein